MSPKSGNPEFTVIGSGIIGISSALALQKEGFRVTVVDREKPDNRVLLEMQVPFPPVLRFPILFRG